MTTDSLSSTIRITEWAVNTLAAANEGTSDVVRKCAEAVLVFALRLLGFNLQRANLFPPAPKVDKDEDKEEEEEEDEAAAKARKEKEKASAAPPPWVDSDADVYATTLWDTDVLLRRVLSTGGIPASAVRQAEATIISLFDTLYPTWRLKHTALDELLAFATSGSSASPPSPADLGRSRLLGVFMAALSSRSDIAMFLETSGVSSGEEAARPAAVEDDGAGAEESKGGDGEGAEGPRAGTVSRLPCHHPLQHRLAPPVLLSVRS